MSREIHARICEGVGVRFPHATRLSHFSIGFIKKHNQSEGCEGAHYLAP